MQQPHHTVDLRQSYEVKREPRGDQKWQQHQMEAFPKQMIYPRAHPSQQKLLQQQQQIHQQQQQHMQTFMHPSHAGAVPHSQHSMAFKQPMYDFTANDLGVYLFGKQDLRMVRIEPRTSENTKQQQIDKGKAAKWCDMCQEIRFGECHKHGPLTKYPSSSTVPLNAPMSYAISTFPDEVGLCVSGLPFAGYGVFARQFIPTGTWIGPYEGTRIPFEEGVKKMSKDTPFLWEICANGRVSHFLDASDENTSSWMRFIQCARFKAEQNLFVFQYCSTIYYRAFKDVPPGVELLVWYDEKYPQIFGLPLEINDMATCSVESIQNSNEKHGESTSTMAPSSGAGHPGEQIPNHPGGLIGNEIIRREIGKSPITATSSSFAFPRPGMLHHGGPSHIQSGGSFHHGPVPPHIRQRHEAPHPSMSHFTQSGASSGMLIQQGGGSSIMTASGRPIHTSAMQVDEGRLPNAPLPVQLIDKARIVMEEPSRFSSAEGKDNIRMAANMNINTDAPIIGIPTRMMLSRPMGPSSSLGPESTSDERKSPEKAPIHGDFNPGGPYGPNSWPWTCNICGKSFNHKSMLQNHACVRSSPSGLYRCDRCPLTFGDPIEAREHMESHLDRSFKCRFCPRTFSSGATLTNHMRTHTSERAFECTACGKLFAQANHLTHHQKTPGECQAA